MILTDETYSETYSRDILTQIPFSLIAESISEQVKDPVNVSMNYLSVIIDKSDIAAKDASDEDSATIQDALSEFLIEVIGQISDSFDLGVDLNALNNPNEIRELAESLYEFYIVFYRQNLAQFITNYINEHKKDLYELFDAEKVDVSSLRWKKLLKDRPEDVVILSNLPHITKYIIDLDIEPAEMLRLANEGDDYAPEYIRTMIFQGILLGGSTRVFAQKCLDDHDYIIGEIETEIKIAMLQDVSLQNTEDEE